MNRAKRKGWLLVALDFGLDTTTPAGEMVANVILSTAQYKGRLIGQRTRDALAAKRDQGIRLGRPRVYQMMWSIALSPLATLDHRSVRSRHNSKWMACLQPRWSDHTG
jgi:DNA invertase Pin-like site-specific DNA recombinase